MGPLPRWLSLTVIFLVTVATLGTLAQEVARTFALFEPLDAYRLDIGGSLLGIVTFAGLSFLRMPPLAWAVVVGRRLRRAPRAPRAVASVAAGGRHHGGRRDAGAGVVRRLVPVVAVLQDPHRDRVRRQRAHRRQQHPAADHGLGRADHQGLTVLPLPLHVRRPARRRARHRCGHRQRRRGRAEPGRQAGRRGRDRPGPGADRARPASGPALLRPPGDGARRRRPRLHGAHRRALRPRALRAARLGDDRHRASRRCAWRTTCSPPRR